VTSKRCGVVRVQFPVPGERCAPRHGANGHPAKIRGGYRGSGIVDRVGTESAARRTADRTPIGQKDVQATCLMRETAATDESYQAKCLLVITLASLILYGSGAQRWYLPSTATTTTFCPTSSTMLAAEATPGRDTFSRRSCTTAESTASCNILCVRSCADRKLAETLHESSRPLELE
jgi:hypothetical protein